jgi:hypothetical protein
MLGPGTLNQRTSKLHKLSCLAVDRGYRSRLNWKPGQSELSSAKGLELVEVESIGPSDEAGRSELRQLAGLPSVRDSVNRGRQRATDLCGFLSATLVGEKLEPTCECPDESDVAIRVRHLTCEHLRGERLELGALCHLSDASLECQTPLLATLAFVSQVDGPSALPTSASPSPLPVPPGLEG